jgi:formylglycine-generating enzyme required for sulfatase activity
VANDRYSQFRVIFEENLSWLMNFEPIFFLVGNNFSIAWEEGKKEEVKKSDFGMKKLEKKEKEGNVIAVQSSKTKKKKFPWLLVVGGVIVVGVVVALLLIKKKDNNNGNDESDYDTSVLGIEWVQIPAGEFKMGDNFNEGDYDELPVHTVYLDTYYISKYEVTFDQYDSFCEAFGRSKPNDKGWGRGTRPVINVSWDDAKDFCNWLAGKTGKNIHLPTEAQWEKAVRGTDQRRYPWGNGNPSCSRVNYHYCNVKTMPVGSYPSGVSPYGIHDMAGNVWEWCSDWYYWSYYSSSPYKNPTGPSHGSYRVFRGGSWVLSAGNCRASVRLFYRPANSWPDGGFRLARSL